MTRSLIVVLAVVLAPGCGGKKDAGPPCDQVTDHILAVTKKAYPGHGEEALGRRADHIATCEARKMSADERRCLMAATDLPGMAKCRPAQRKGAPGPGGGGGGSAAPAPAPGGGSAAPAPAPAPAPPAGSAAPAPVPGAASGSG